MGKHRERFMDTEEKVKLNEALFGKYISQGMTIPEAYEAIKIDLIKKGRINMDILFRHHYRCWNYLYENPTADKYDVPVVLEHYDMLEHFHNCFLCFASQVPVRTCKDEEISAKLSTAYCVNCPLNTAGQKCSEQNSWYWKWNFSDNPEIKKLFAKQIRDVVKSMF